MNCEMLIVEDDADIREQLSIIIEDEGIIVHACSNGQEALDYLQSMDVSKFPKCILMDLMMPVMDGARFYEALQGDQKLRTIPVVLATARGEREKTPEIFPEGIDRINKPMDISDLLQVIEKYCKKES